MTTIETTEESQTTTRHGKWRTQTLKWRKTALRILRDTGEQMAVTQGLLAETETDRWRERHGA